MSLRQLHELFRMLEGAYSPNTLRAYQADVEEFMAFCLPRGDRPLPADSRAIAAFLGQFLDGRIQSATIRRKVSSISAVHRLSGHPDPTKETEVLLCMRRIYRTLGRRSSQAYPINRPLLHRLLAATDGDFRGLRDRALLHLAYDSMCRRSELVSLRVEDIHRTEVAMSILLRRSKSDTFATGRWLHLGIEATSAVDAWLDEGRIRDGLLLRGVDSGSNLTDSLSEAQVGRIFKKLARKAGLPKETVAGVSGHSMRVGGAQDLLLAGATLPQIMVKGGWSKPDTVMRYVERIRPDLEGGGGPRILHR